MHKKTVIILLDQAMLSALNMIVAILFIKFSSKFEYGEYSLAFAAMMFAVGFYNTLIHLPLTITGNKIDFGNRPGFVASLCIMLYAILAILTFISVIFLLTVPEIAVFQLRTCWGLIFCVLGVLTRELIRSLFFAELRALNVLNVDILYSFLFIISVSFFYLNSSLSASNVLICMGGSSIISSVFCGKQIVKNIALRLPLRDIYKNVAYSWRDSKWMVAGMIMTWIINNGYLFILAYIVSKEMVAELNGTRVLIAPFVVFVGAWGKIFQPKGASLIFEDNYHHIGSIFWKSTLALLTMAIIYVSVLYNLREYLDEYLYNNQYENVWKYVLLWGGYLFFTILSSNLQNIISIFSRFKELFFMDLVNGAIFLIYACILIGYFSAYGALYSLIIAKIVLVIQFLYFYYTKRTSVFQR